VTASEQQLRAAEPGRCNERHAERDRSRHGPAFDSASHTPRILAKGFAIASITFQAMPPNFDPTHSLQFDLDRGQISMAGAEARLLVPAEALARLCAGAGSDRVRDFGRGLGTEMGRRVMGRLGNSASVSAMVEHLGGELALAGFGSLGIEVWGRALVLTITDSPLGPEGDALIAAVLEGAIQRAVSRDAAVVRIDRANGKSRLAVLRPSTAESVKRWLADGVSWGDILARLSSA
jgi:hypothetical protein